MNSIRKHFSLMVAISLVCLMALAGTPRFIINPLPPAGFSAADAITATGWTKGATWISTTLGDIRLPEASAIRFGDPGTAAILHTNAAGWEIDGANGAALLTIAGVGAPVVGTNGFSTTAATTKGTFTLVAGSATKTVLSGAQCVCGLSVGTVWPKCTVAATTLTITGNGTDTGTYVCF